MKKDSFWRRALVLLIVWVFAAFFFLLVLRQIGEVTGWPLYLATALTVLGYFIVLLVLELLRRRKRKKGQDGDRRD